MKTTKSIILGLAVATLGLSNTFAQMRPSQGAPVPRQMAGPGGASRPFRFGDRNFDDRFRFHDFDNRFRFRNTFFFNAGFPFFFPYAYGYPYPYYGYYPPPPYYGYGYGYGSPGYGGYRPGYSGSGNASLVVEVQRRLARAGFYHRAIDGVIGSGTRSAIREYKRANGLPSGSRIDRPLLSTLGLA